MVNMKDKFWNVPNALTLLRLFLVPVMLLCFFLIPGRDHLAAMIIFLVASLTDMLDGIIARTTHQITQYGIVLDPLADKLLKISTLVAFAIVGILPIWLVAVLIFLDVGMIITGACLFKQKITIPSNIFGKIGTVIMTIGLLMCFFDGSLNPWNLYVLYLGLIIIVTSLIVYIVLNYKRVFFRNKATLEMQNAEAAEQELGNMETDENIASEQISNDSSDANSDTNDVEKNETLEETNEDSQAANEQDSTTKNE